MGRGAKGRAGGGRAGGRARSHAAPKSHAHKSPAAARKSPFANRNSAAARRRHQHSAFKFTSHRHRSHGSSRPLTPAERLALRIRAQEEVPTGIGSLYLNGAGRICCGDAPHTVSERQLPPKFTDLLSQAEWDNFIRQIDRAFDEEECPTALAVLCALPTLFISLCIAEQKTANLLSKLTRILTAENLRLQPVGLQWVRTPGRAPAMCVLRWLPGVREAWEQANPHRRPVSREPPAREFLPNALQLQMGLNELAGRPAFAMLDPAPPQIGSVQMMFGQPGPPPQQQMQMEVQVQQPQWTPPPQQQQQGMGAGPPQHTMGMEMQPMQQQYLQPMMLQGQMQGQQPQDPVFAYIHPMPLLDAAAAAEGGSDVPMGVPMQPMQGMMQVQPAVVQPLWSPPVYSAHPHAPGQAPLPVYVQPQGPALYCTGWSEHTRHARAAASLAKTRGHVSLVFFSLCARCVVSLVCFRSGAPKTLRIDQGPNPSNECESCGQVNK